MGNLHTHTKKQMALAPTLPRKQRLSSQRGTRSVLMRLKLLQLSSSMALSLSASMPTLSRTTRAVLPTHCFATHELSITELPSLVSAPTVARITGLSVTVGEPPGVRPVTSAWSVARANAD